MASNLGNIYVQLQLDDKLYKQKLSETLGDAQATAKGLETSWRSLGVKTNKYFDDSRKAAENAYSHPIRKIQRRSLPRKGQVKRSTS